MWVRSSRPCISCLPWLSLFSVGLCLCASRVAAFSWCCGALLFRCCCSVFCCGCCLFVDFPCGLVLAVWPALSRSPLPSPLGCLLVVLVVSGPVSVLLVPPSGYLVVSATVRLSYLWYGVSWLIGSCLHSAPWQQRLRPCVGLCPPWCRCCSCAPRSVTEVFAFV